MKEIASLLFVLIALCSCSGDDAGIATSEPVVNGTKLKRVTFSTNGGASIISTSDYVYNGNKVDKIWLNGLQHWEYFYAGELITRMDFFRTDGSLAFRTVLVYNGNAQLTEKISYDYTPNTATKILYTHNSDGTISLSSFTGDLNTQNTPTDLNSKVFLNPDGTVSKIEKYQVENGNPVIYTEAYTYDNAFVPYHQITGFSKLTFYELGGQSNMHNIATITYTASNSAAITVDTVQNIYNTFNYLSVSTLDTFVTKCFYEAN